MTQINAVDENNDWFLGEDKHLAISRDLQAVLEQCEHVAKVVVGELVFAIDRGVLGFEEGGTFGNSPDLLLFDSRARTAWLGVPDVIEVVSLDANIVNNELQYQATIKTTFGTDTISNTDEE